MQFLKQIKSKALNIQIFDKKPNNQQQKPAEQLRTENANQKQVTIKSIAKSIFNKFKQESNTSDKATQATTKISTAPLVLKQGRIWMTAPTQAKQSAKEQKNSINVDKKHIKEDFEEIDEGSAGKFIENMQKSIEINQKQSKMKINKAKNSIFGNLQIQPIYLSQDSIAKILAMEFEASHDLLIERTQSLVLERITVDKSIQNVLCSGYLWEAHGLSNRDIVSASFQLIDQNYQKVQHQSSRLRSVRQRFELITKYLKKINSLNVRRTVLAKKIKLLNKIKSYKKEACIQFENIDQAFYIQRNRQKLYDQLKGNEKLLSKTILLQSFIRRIERQNQKVVSLVENQLSRWVDQSEKLEAKNVQKVLILLYFIRNEKMYLKNGSNVDLSKLMNKRRLIQQLNQVKQWKDYKYVNDGMVKAKVSEFLDSLISWLEKEEEKYPYFDRKKQGKRQNQKTRD